MTRLFKNEPATNFFKENITKDTVFVVTGASGWFGKTTLCFLWELLGEKVFSSQVKAFSSRNGIIQVDDKFCIPTQSLGEIFDLSDIDYIFHYAFLTRDRLKGVGLRNYIDLNVRITDIVMQCIEKYNIRGIFNTSSGAVYNPEGGLFETDHHLLTNPYAVLKFREEQQLLDKCSTSNTNCIVMRVFSVMGEFMTKPRAFAVGDFTYQAINNKHINIHSDRPVWRSYTHIRDLVHLALKYLVTTTSMPICIDTSGEIVEMEHLAIQILSSLKIEPTAYSRSWDPYAVPNKYIGNSKDIKLLASALDISFLTFEEQVLHTINYLQNI